MGEPIAMTVSTQSIPSTFNPFDDNNNNNSSTNNDTNNNTTIDTIPFVTDVQIIDEDDDNNNNNDNRCSIDAFSVSADKDMTVVVEEENVNRRPSPSSYFPFAA